MRNDPYAIQKHVGKVVLVVVPAVGNNTIPVSATPFKLRDTDYYQVNAAGDYVQGRN